jgi:hypothetical protein
MWQPGTVQAVPGRRVPRPTPVSEAPPPSLPASGLQMPVVTLPVVQVAVNTPSSRETTGTSPSERAPVTVATLPPAAAISRDQTVYSRRDADIEPPVMLSALMPPPIDWSRDGRPNNTLVFVVSALGTVDSVKFLHQTRNLIDTTYLSTAKLIKFAPAKRRGTPVRYELHVDWANPKP